MDFNFMQLGAMQGWQCPICKKILAPFVPECPCQGEGKKTITTTGGTSINIDWTKQNIKTKEE